MPVPGTFGAGGAPPGYYDEPTRGAGPVDPSVGTGGAGPGPVTSEPAAGAELPPEAAAGVADILSAVEARRAAAAPQGPAMAAPGRPVPARVPAEYAPQDGLYYPPEDEYLSSVETARLRGELTDPQARAAEQRYARWQGSPEGLATDIARDQMAAQQEQGELAQDAYRSSADAAAERAGLYEQAQRQAAERARRAAEQRAQMMADYQSQIDRYKAAVDDVKTAKIDPQRFWKNQSTGMRILGAIAMGLGAVGETVGIKNHAADIISQAVDADIEAQQANIANQRAALGDQQGILAFMRDRIDDNDQAATAAKAQVYENLANYVEQKAAMTESALLKNKAKGLASQLRNQQSIQEKQLELGAANLARQMAMQRAAAQAAAAQAAAERRQKMEQLRGYRPLDPKEAKYIIPGYGIAAPTTGESSIPKLRDEAARIATYNENLGRAIQLAEQGGTWSTLSPKDRAEIQQLYYFVFNPEVKELSGAAVTEHEMERYQKQFGKDPASTWDSVMYDVPASMRRLKDQLNRGFANRLKAYGVSGDVRKIPNPETGRWEWHVQDLPRQQAEDDTGAYHDSPQ